LFEFAGADFSQAFEARDLRIFAELGCRSVAFGFAVSIDCLLFVADAEQRRF
jgi:hypothetical protein